MIDETGLVYQDLQAHFAGDLVLPSHHEYGSVLKRWSKLAERPAGLVAFAKTEEDVALAINFAVKHGLEIAAAATILPARRRLTAVWSSTSRDISTKSRSMWKPVAHVEGGALWSDVDDATCVHDLATVGGTVSHTGVGGLTVGGGYGFLTGRHGLTIDNVVGVTIVLASGEIVKASSTENEDLFFGVRGGGVNFGVVTRFSLALHPTPPVCWSGIIAFSPDKLEELVEACIKWKDVMGPDDIALLGLSQNPRTDEQALMLLVNHLGAADSARKHFKMFYDLGPVADMTTEKPYKELNKFLNQMVPHGRSYYMAGATVTRPAVDTIKRVWALQAQLIQSMPAVKSMIGFEFFALEQVNAVPNDAMAFCCRGPHMNVIINLRWEDREGATDKVDLDQVRGGAKELINAIQGDRMDPETPYGNYEGDQAFGNDKVKKLFGSNYPKLQAIKAKYDPNLVFGKWFPIQPAKRTNICPLRSTSV